MPIEQDISLTNTPYQVTPEQAEQRARKAYDIALKEQLPVHYVEKNMELYDSGAYREKIDQWKNKIENSPDEERNKMMFWAEAGKVFNITSYMSRKGWLFTEENRGNTSAFFDAMQEYHQEAKRPTINVFGKDIKLPHPAYVAGGVVRTAAEFEAIPIGAEKGATWIGKMGETAGKFAAQTGLQAPTTQESAMDTGEFVKQRAGAAIKSGVTGAGVSVVGKFMPNPLYRIPTATGGFMALTALEGGTADEVVQTGIQILGFEALGLAQQSIAGKADIKKAVEAAREKEPKLKDVPDNEVERILKVMVNAPEQKGVANGLQEKGQKEGQVTPSIAEKQVVSNNIETPKQQPSVNIPQQDTAKVIELKRKQLQKNLTEAKAKLKTVKDISKVDPDYEDRVRENIDVAQSELDEFNALNEKPIKSTEKKPKLVFEGYEIKESGGFFEFEGGSLSLTYNPAMNTVYFHPEINETSRNKGIGTKYINKLKAFADKHGIILQGEVLGNNGTDSKNAVRIYDFYMKNGFTGEEGLTANNDRFVTYTPKSLQQSPQAEAGKGEQATSKTVIPDRIQKILDENLPRGIDEASIDRLKLEIKNHKSDLSLLEGQDKKDYEEVILVLENKLAEKQGVSPPVTKSDTTVGNAKAVRTDLEPSRLAERTEELAIEAELIKDAEFRPLAGYEKEEGFIKEQARLSRIEMDMDWENSIKMALGLQKPSDPKLRVASLYRAVALRARAKGDIETLRQLGSESTVPTLLSEYGKEIKAADVRDDNEDVEVIRRVKNNKEKSVDEKLKKQGSSLKAEKERISKNMKDKINEKPLNLDRLKKFIEDIRCV